MPDELWGTAADGDVTISSNTQLAANKNYRNLTVNSGVTLDTAGYTVRVRGTLTNNGTITDAQSGGAGGSAGSAGAGGIKGSGTIPTNGGTGGTGGSPGGGAGNGGQGGGGGGGGGYIPYLANGAAGGTGGVGGKGGGKPTLYVFRLVNNGTIHADGAAGSTGSGGGNGEYYHWLSGDEKSGYTHNDVAGGGGGGGGGGYGGNGGTVTIYYAYRPAAGTVRANGGNYGGGGSAGYAPARDHGCGGTSRSTYASGGSPNGGAGYFGQYVPGSALYATAGSNGGTGSVGSASQTQHLRTAALFFGM